MSHVARSILLACWWALGSALAPVCIASTISPSSVAQATAVSAGVNSWTIGDAAGTWDALRAMTTTPSSVSSSGALTVQTAAKVPTKHGAVDAVIKREIPYSRLVSPWKKALKVVPFVGTGLVVAEILSEMCIRSSGVDIFEKCVKREDVVPPQILFVLEGSGPVMTRVVSNPESYLSGLLRAAYPNLSGAISCNRYPNGGPLENVVCSTPGGASRSVQSYAVCDGEIVGWYTGIKCSVSVVEGWEPATTQDAEGALDNYPSKYPEKLAQRVPKLWGDLQNRPEGTPLDQRSVDATGLSSPTITPKTPADTAKAGPKTTETTSTGTKVTQETATITYQGNTTTVTNNTSVTNINNEGNVINESTTTEQGPTDCEKNPSAIACLELGDPPSGDIPRKDESWQITAESLPGGACPGGFVWPVPGSPEFSWQPLCDRLPAARAVVLVLASVLAAWIVVGGLSS